VSNYFTIEKYEFLNKKGLRSHIIKTLLTNRLFILSLQRLIAAIYRYYEKNLLKASNTSGKRILAICRKKDA